MIKIASTYIDALIVVLPLTELMSALKRLEKVGVILNKGKGKELRDFREIPNNNNNNNSVTFATEHRENKQNNKKHNGSANMSA